MSPDLEQEQAAAPIRERLFALAEPGYRDFTAKLIPNLDPDRILGVRSPALRAMARALRGTRAGADFLAALPHRYRGGKSPPRLSAGL